MVIMVILEAFGVAFGIKLTYCAVTLFPA